ncbi:coiled-coil domain-containing protein 167 [Lampris incognitus]|uniref:coiled-coil domain-containing protein 167 n=1 Tax=Lampris incognitus TaxID=2546036 RepID=UPI0024B5741D|nr:coiled-coil domain-containing protein 167 [Lampris incognitus]
MTKSKDKKLEKISVASEIDRMEEKRSRCQASIERAEYRRRCEKHSDRERKELEDRLAVMQERVKKFDNELVALRGENRRNMMLSVALLVVSALFYYAFFFNEEDLS